MNNLYPFHDKLLTAEIEKYSRTKHFNDGEIIIQPGDAMVHVPIVIKGSIRVLRENEAGSDVFLYHILPQETCAMSLNCCHSRKKSLIKAVAEDETEVLLVPSELIDDWMKYPEWKNFIISTYANRYAELIDIVDLIAFSNMDKQLMHYLQKRAEALHTTALHITHQQIADELHTQREAISRLLRKMEDKGLVKLGRNVIELLS